MFKVTVDSLDDYLAFDPVRRADLEAFDRLMREAAPSLERHFHQGTPAGRIGMRMKMIGYGHTTHGVASGETTPWPVIGVALQKNYISVYVAVTKDGAPLVDTYVGQLGELRSGSNNFSFRRFADLDAVAVGRLVAETAEVFAKGGAAS